MMFQALTSRQEDFVRRINCKAGKDIFRDGLLHWIEDEAERLACLGRSGRYVDLNRIIQKEPSICNVLRGYPYRELLKEGRESFTGSIRLSSNGHSISFQYLRDKEERAVIAHELAHAFLHENTPFRKFVSASGLNTDPAIERLVDDVARAILLPKSLLEDLIEEFAVDGEEQSVWDSAVKISSAARIPVRIGITRIARFFLNDAAIIVHCSAPAQRSFFSVKNFDVAQIESSEVKISVPWIMRYHWHNPSSCSGRYFFSDKVADHRKLVFKGERIQFAETTASKAIPRSMAYEFAGCQYGAWLEEFECFYRFGCCADDEFMRYFIMCRGNVH